MRRLKSREIGLVAAALLMGTVVLNAQAPPPASARLAIRSGLVEVQRGNAWFPIMIGDSINPGEHLRTASGSAAAIQMGEGRIVTINEQSQVQIGQSPAAPVVQLESGSMKVFATSEILVAAKDTMLEGVERPLDMELGFQSDRLNLTVFNGAVRNGPMIIRGGNQDPTVRNYSAGGRFSRTAVPNPTFYVYPYFMYGNRGTNGGGAIVPPPTTKP
jgi:ferric-dicitrate binding protein FerR (iron transport regulator)